MPSAIAKPSPSLSVIYLQALTPRLRRRRILVSKSCAVDISNFFRHLKGRRMDRSGQRMEEGGQTGNRRHEGVATDRPEPRPSVARTPRLRNKRPEQTRASGMMMVVVICCAEMQNVCDLTLHNPTYRSFMPPNLLPYAALPRRLKLYMERCTLVPSHQNLAVSDMQHWDKEM